MSRGTGILKSFDKAFYAYEVSLCSLIWDNIAYNAKVEKGEVQDVFVDIMDEDSDEEVLCVDISDYYSFKELLASYPVLFKNEGVGKMDSGGARESLETSEKVS